MCLHLVALIVLFVLPKILAAEKRSISSKASTEKTTSTGTVDACDINEKPTTTTTTTDKLNDFKKTNSVNATETMCGINGNDMDNLSHMIREKIDCETRNIENFIDKTVDKTVTGIVELKDDLMNYGNEDQIYGNADGVRQRNVDKKMTENENFIQKEIEALNNAVQQNNVLPAVLSNGHAK